MELHIDLKRYTVYPEIITDDESGEWLARLIKRNGDIVQEFKGVVDKPKTGSIVDVVMFRKAATINAYEKFNTVIAGYKTGGKK